MFLRDVCITTSAKGFFFPVEFDRVLQSVGGVSLDGLCSSLSRTDRRVAPTQALLSVCVGTRYTKATVFFYFELPPSELSSSMSEQ